MKAKIMWQIIKAGIHARISEPSTWAGIAAIIGAVTTPEIGSAAAQLGMAAAGLAAVLLREQRD